MALALQEPELTEAHLLRLREDVPLYAAANLKIRTKPSGGKPGQLLLFDMNWAQRLVHARAERQREETGRVRVLVLKARQLGISTYIAARLYHGCTLWSHRRGMVLADELKRSEEIFAIYERYDQHNAIRPPKLTTRRAREMSWATDSRLTVETARDKDTGRGSTLDYAHLSEFASYLYPKETMTGVQDAVPEDAGEIWVESTAKGVGNEFHEMWRQAVAGESEWLPVFLPWWLDPGYRSPLDEQARGELLANLDAWERQAMEVGIGWESPGDEIPTEFPSGARYNAETGRWVLSLEQIAWRRRKIRTSGELVFRQENPATAKEAFLVSGDPFFDVDRLDEMDEVASDPIWRGTLDVRFGKVQPLRSPRGWLRIWEMPEAQHHYVIAADTASGREVGPVAATTDPEGERGGRDFDSADVIRLGYWSGTGPQRVFVKARQVAQIHSRRMAPEVFADQLYGLGTMYSCPVSRKADRREPSLLAVERNHESGVTTIRCLKDKGYPNLFTSRPIAGRREKPTDRLGWVTSGETRRPMLDELARAVRDGTLEVPCHSSIDELLTFVYGEDGKPQAQDGAHDDRVISLGIAVAMLRFHGHAVAEPEPGDHDFTEPEVADTPTGWG